MSATCTWPRYVASTGIDEHQFDVGALGDDLTQPTIVPVVLDDLTVQLAGLFGGDLVEIDTVQIAKRGEQVAVKAGRPRIVEVASSL